MKNWIWVWQKKPIVCKLGDLGVAKSMYTQPNALSSKYHTTTIHRSSLAFIAAELIIGKLSKASAGIDKLKTGDTWTF